MVSPPASTEVVLPVVTAETVVDAPVVAVVDAVAEATLLETDVALEAVALLELEELEELALQERSKRGVVLKVLPTTPKLGFGVEPSVSWRVYHQVLR
jgi:hypothetical protein